MPEFDPDFSIIDGDFRVGDFHVRPLLKIVRPLKAGEDDEDDEDDERRLPDKAMAVLLLLAENPREVCERDYLLDEVWGAHRESYDRVLDNAIREIRRAFGDDARKPEYVQTIAKTGYRLIAEVEMEPWSDASRAAPNDEPKHEEIQARAAGGEATDAEIQDADTGGADTEGAESERAVAGDVVSPSEATGGGHDDGGRPISWPVIALLLAVVAASGLLASVYRSSDRLFVQVSLEPDGGGPPLDPAAVEEVFSRMVEQEHSCGPSSLLFAGPRWLRPGSNLPVTLDSRRSEGRLQLESVISFDSVDSLERPPPDRVIVGLMANEPVANGLERLADKTVGRIDAAICRDPEFPDVARSCHCIASFRTWSFPDSPQPQLEYLETGVRLDPQNLAALDHLLEIYLWAGYRDRAEREASRGLELVQDFDSPEAIALLRRLAQIHRDRQEEGRLLEELHRKDPENPHWGLARSFHLLFHHNDCAAALVALEHLTRSFPQRSDVLGLKAEVLHLCGRSRQARDSLREIVHASPEQIANKLRFSNISAFLGDYETARTQAKEAFAVVPESNEIRTLLGRVEKIAGAYRTADLWFERALEVSTVPREEEMTKSQRAFNALVAGRAEEALEILQTVDPSVMVMDLLPRYLEGWAHLELGDLESARETSERMRALHAPRRTAFQAHFLLALEARIQHAEGRPDEALATLDRALEKIPFVRTDVLFAKGRIALESDRHEIAEDAFRRLFGLNPNHGLGLCAAGAFYADTGRTDRAVEHLRRGLENLDEPAESDHGRECLERYQELTSSSER